MLPDAPVLNQKSLQSLLEDQEAIPNGSIVVPFCGLYLGSYKAIPKRNYYGDYR